MSTLDINSTRANEIDAWIRDRPEMEVAELKAPIELHGETKYHPVWKIPIKLLTYNIRNGRFAAEVMAKERDLRRNLDPSVAADAKIIQTLLLDQNKGETEELESSLKENGQLHEGIITFDGSVVNANRRMAVLSKLYEETGDPRFDYLKVARLPKAVDEKDIWRIEAGLQFAKDLKLEYGPVNELLKLREGINRGLTARQISHALLGRYTPDEVEKRIKVLELIDSYLDSIGKPGDYRTFTERRVVERFNSLSNNVIEPMKRREEIPKTEIPRVISLGFSLINSGKVTHWEIRKLRSITNSRNARAALEKDFAPGDYSQSSLDKTLNAFRLADVINEAEKNRDKPKQLAEDALASLNSIDKRNSKLKEPEVQQLLVRISQLVKELLGQT